MRKTIRHLPGALHTLEWGVSLWEWSRPKLVWLAGLIPVGAGVMSWKDIAPWLVTIVIAGGWIVLLADHFIKRRKVGDREGLKMAEELLAITRHQFGAWAEFKEGVADKSIRRDVLYRKFRGHLRGRGEECPDSDPPHNYILERWLLDYIEKESTRLSKSRRAG